MLELFEKFARRRQSWRQPLLLALVLSAGGFFALVTVAPTNMLDRVLIPLVLLILWLLLVYSSLNLFAVIPGTVDPAQPWLHRLKQSLYRLLYQLYAWFMLLVSLALVVTSLQLGMAWIRMG